TARVGANAPGLVAETTSFVGREAQLTELLKLCTDTRMLSLVGPGGVGKSRLAARVGAAAASMLRSGMRSIDLATIADPRLVPFAVAHGFGIRNEDGQAWYQKLIDWLGERRLLL